MSKVVGIGACVLDTLITLPNFPPEDTKLRATSTKLVGGGPTATGIVAVSKLGISSEFLGNLSDDSSGAYLKGDFEKYGVGTDNISMIPGYRAFTSCIWLNAAEGTRTCVFDKGDLPALKLTEGQIEAIKNADVLMVDGNEMDAAVEAAKIAKASGTKVLYDCGGLYDGVERLLALTDIMIPSEEFAMGHTGEKDAASAAKKLYELYSPDFVVVTRGKHGGLLFDGKTVTEYPIYPADVVDSNGSGDVFHGAFASAVVRGYTPIQCCHFSSCVSALKCMGVGARESVPSFEATIEYLRRNGYEL